MDLGLEKQHDHTAPAHPVNAILMPHKHEQRGSFIQIGQVIWASRR